MATTLSGEDLYNEYARIELRENNCHVDPWEDLTHFNRHAWDELAEFVRLHVQQSISDVFT